MIEKQIDIEFPINTFSDKNLPKKATKITKKWSVRSCWYNMDNYLDFFDEKKKNKNRDLNKEKSVANSKSKSIA